jgi:hypothetical protein
MANSVQSIREALPVTGRIILEVTATDWEDVVAEQPDPATRISRIYLHFDDGSTASFAVGDGDLAFSYDNFPDGHPFRQED